MSARPARFFRRRATSCVSPVRARVSVCRNPTFNMAAESDYKGTITVPCMLVNCACLLRPLISFYLEFPLCGGCVFVTRLWCVCPPSVADIKLADFGRKEIELAEVEMPGLMAARTEYGPSQTLKGA